MNEIENEPDYQISVSDNVLYSIFEILWSHDAGTCLVRSDRFLQDRKSVVLGKSVDEGGGRFI